jgi:CubicO group peptidase (beta-lactamase class C family)
MDNKISDICVRAISRHVFPGCVVGYIRGGRITVLPYGHLTYESGSDAVRANTVYDVASISKSVPTSSIVLKLAEEGKLSLDGKVSDYIPELENQYLDRILIRHLLTYSVIFNTGTSLTEVALKSPDRIMESIFTAPLLAPPGTKHMYTDAPAILMGLIAERICNRSLGDIAQAMFFSPLQMNRTTYDELDWRGEVRAIPQDEKAWVLRAQGQTPGHAGLFSTGKDLLTFSSMLLNHGIWHRKTYFKEETVKWMHTNQNSSVGEAESLGWQMQRARWMGEHISSEAFGRTGYPGTSILIDPHKQIALVHLSNHTYPSRPTERAVAINAVRRELADTVFGQE